MATLSFQHTSDISNVCQVYADTILVYTSPLDAFGSGWLTHTISVPDNTALAEFQYYSGSGHMYIKEVTKDTEYGRYPDLFPYSPGESHANAFTGAVQTLGFQGLSGTNFQWNKQYSVWDSVAAPGAGGTLKFYFGVVSSGAARPPLRQRQKLINTPRMRQQVR